jgi:hypothetical protein
MANEGCIVWTIKTARHVDWKKKEICEPDLLIDTKGYEIISAGGKEIKPAKGTPK